MKINLKSQWKILIRSIGFYCPQIIIEIDQMILCNNISHTIWMEHSITCKSRQVFASILNLVSLLINYNKITKQIHCQLISMNQNNNNTEFYVKYHAIFSKAE